MEEYGKKMQECFASKTTEQAKILESSDNVEAAIKKNTEELAERNCQNQESINNFRGLGL